ncbi:hypothetical protein [Escherichia coli]|uniref:hypothetical protein n=1 Tax=Escherichia coli TaxID=562 RepID=UPI0023DD3FBC|nr:hypothetical protein [Escherichia coli]WJR87875.1 hypothetical protein ZYB62GM000006 [Escherichia coli]
MKIIEKIINAFLVVQHKKIQVKNITFLDNGQGMFSGMSFDADVSLEFMYESAKAYSSCFCDIPFPGFEDANLEEITKFQLDALKQRKNHSFFVNHLRFPIVLREGCKSKEEKSIQFRIALIIKKDCSIFFLRIFTVSCIIP